MNFLLGSDPELFVSRKGNIVPSSEVTFGTSECPEVINIPNLGYDISLHQDNVLVEFCSVPSHNKEMFVNQHTEIINYLDISFKEIFNVDIESLFEMKIPNHKKIEGYKKIGCTPSFNAYYANELFPSDEAEKKFKRLDTRWGGGHLHIGYPKESKIKSETLIKTLDLLLGTYLIPFENSVCPGSFRRNYYGEAGSYRRMPGVKVEYRTPSNVWLFNKELMNTVYDIVEIAVTLVLEKDFKVKAAYQKTIESYINTGGDIALSPEILEYRNKLLKIKKTV